MAKIDWSRWAPPNQDARKEVIAFSCGLAACTAVMWFYVLSHYWNARSRLFTLTNGVQVLREGAEMPVLPLLLGTGFLPLCLLAGTAVSTVFAHYVGHYREGSRPVYLMRRLPDRWEYHRRCLAIPGTALLAALAIMALSLWAFWGIYMTATPAQCLPPDPWYGLLP